MRYRDLRIGLAASLVVGLLLTISCGMGRISWGVVLWSENEELLQNGALVSIISKSELYGTYTIKVPGSGEKINIIQGKVLPFKKKKEADEFIAEYTPYLFTFAVSKKNGSLPIRSKPKASAENIYRLRPGTSIKILSRSEKPAKVGNLEDYWYGVLTNDGISGYCFGHSLRIFNSKKMDAGQAVRISDEDAILEEFFNKNWRHSSFQEMIDRGQINLDNFQLGYGIFPDKKNRLIKIVTPDHSLRFDYSAISTAGTAFYLFKGTNLKIAVRSNNELFVKYTHKNKDYRDTYIYIEESKIEEYVNKEEERRNNLYAELHHRGNILKSSDSGTIILDDYKKFTWTKAHSLFPDILPGASGDDGIVEFPLFLSRELRRNYKGAISFHFNGTPEKFYIHFLYNLTEEGLELVYLPEKHIDKDVALEESPVLRKFLFTFFDKPDTADKPEDAVDQNNLNE